MKLTMPRSDPKEALLGLGRIIPTRTTLPVLHGIRFEAGAHVLICGTNLDQYASYQANGEVLEPGACVVDLEKIKPFAKGADADLLTLESTPERLTLTNPTHGQSIAHNLSVYDPEEWPANPPAIDTQPVGEEFITRLQLAMPFASTDRTRIVLNGVHLDASGKDGHRLVATDGRRLTCFPMGTLPIAESCTVPTCKFLEWSKRSGVSRIGLSKTGGVGWFRLEAGRWGCTMRLTDGTFPDWHHVVPGDVGKSFLTVADQDVALLKTMLATFPGREDVNGLICLSGTSGHLTVKGRNPGEEKWTTFELPASTAKGDDIEVGVSRDFLMEALEAGFRTFGATDARSPLYALLADGSAHVLMPIRIAAESAPEAPPTVEPAQTIETASPVAEPQKKEKTMPAKIVPEKTQEPGALDRLIAAFDAAKSKVREANEALAQVAGAIKEAIREDKQRRTEIDTVRAGLLKLQAIRV